MITALTVVSLALALTTLKLLQTLRRLARHERSEHAKCTAHVAHYVGDSFAATVLEAAAEDYDSARGKHRLAVLRNTHPIPEGVSVPAYWLKDRAHDLRLRARNLLEETP